MTTLIAQVPLSFVGNGDLVTITRPTSDGHVRKEVSITGKIEGLTETRHGLFATYQFTLVEANGIRTNLCGLSRWILNLHIPFWDEFNRQHGYNMRSWVKADLAIYRVWTDILALNGLCREQMVDRYVESLISGTACPIQDREAYLHFVNGNA